MTSFVGHRGTSLPLRIGLLIDDSVDRYNGVQQIVRTTGRWLLRQGHSVHVITANGVADESYATSVVSLARTVQVPFNGNRVSVPIGVQRRSAATIASELELDVLHVHAPYSPLLAHRVILGAPSGCKVVASFHMAPKGLLARYGARGLALATSRSLRRVGTVLVDSPVSNDLLEFAWARTGQMLPNPIELLPPRPRPERSQQVRLVFVGRLVKRKGCFELLDVINLLRNEDIELRIVGEGPERGRLERRIRELGLSDRVVIVGEVSERAKQAHLRDADIAIFPSLYAESFGMVILEALASGAEVVLGADNQGYAHVLGRTPDALFPPRDPVRAADVVRRFVGDAELRRRIGSEQRELLGESDIERVGRVYLEAYGVREGLGP